MTRAISGFFWITIFLAVVLLPVALMLVSPLPSGRLFWLEMSVAFGFFGLTQIAVQFVLIARFKAVTAPYGIDVILQFHRQLALVAIAAIIVHPLIIVLDNPSRLKLLNPLEGNWASRFALLSLLALVAIAVTTLFRERLKIDYEYWRLSHLALGVAAVVFAQLHVSMAGLYTNTFWKQAIWIVMAITMVGLVVYLRVIKPLVQKGNRWRVAQVRPERGRTWSLVLEPVDHPGMRFLPGQFAWIKIANTPFTLEEHPFSFSSSAQREDRVEFGIKELGDFTSTIKDLKPGTLANLDGPYGAFCIDRYPAVGYVFIAGGVGITPMISFLRSMADRRDPRPILLIYAVGTEDDLAFHENIEELRELLDLKVVYVLQNPPDGWEGESGFVTSELLERHVPQELIHRYFFVCGPPPMMGAVYDALMALGVRKELIHQERFNLA